MADEQSKFSNRPPAERYYTEYVEISADGGTANELLREAINQELQWGWKLQSARRRPSGDVIELVWDTSGS